MRHAEVLEHLEARDEEGDEVPELDERPELAEDRAAFWHVWTIIRSLVGPAEPTTAADIAACLDAAGVERRSLRMEYLEVLGSMEAERRRTSSEMRGGPD